ncbi:thyrotropin-releasing hormone-degrading ectoenzyme-like [Cimex lectularius]|uniref:Aminopeptidase n=1 Tax=Cimex lectularius TaxID=79782 RepID=A0A8I6R8R7_CIMLE|nr:thyrotropin-releasing hormone-degrading ectoenzyme-like [Cimex lectularius]
MYEKCSVEGEFDYTLVYEYQPNVHQIVISNDYKGKELEVSCYELNLSINLKSKEFTTEVKIIFNTTASRQFLVLKTGDYEISSVELKKGDLLVPIETIINYKPAQSLVIHLEQKLLQNEYVLTIKGKGLINETMNGLCFVSLKNSDSYLLITQMRPNNAQSLFPCFDQAQLLATFQFNLMAPSDEFLKPVSNTQPEKFITGFPEEHMTTVSFSKTTLMHPSKFFLALGNYTHSEPFVTKGGFIITIISRNEISYSLQEIPKLTKTILEILTKYFHTTVPTNSLNIILVPKPWPYMACAGIPGILICEESLLTNLKKKNCMEFIKSIMFLVHELCHSWLGGDVTIDNWDDEWILEGIVSIVAHECGEMLYPQWYDEWIPIMHQIFPLLHFKSNINTGYFKHSNILGQIFSEHSHEEFINTKCKSMALFRMVWSISPTAFRVVLINLLNRKERVNDLHIWNDLWSDVEVQPEALLQDWNKSPKYPVINVRTTYKDNDQVLTQSVFQSITSKSDFDPYNQNYSWTIPIKYIDLTQPKIILKIWFPQDIPEVTITNLKGKWLKINWHQRGLFRVNYTYDQWGKFTEMLNKNPSLLDPQDRANLVDDAFSLASAGYFQYHVALELSSYITHGEERQYFPLTVSFHHLRKMYLLFYNKNGQALLQKYIHHILFKYIQQNVWQVNKLSPTETLRRVEIISAACWSGYQPVLDTVRESFLDWLDEKENPNLHVDLIDCITVYGLAGRVDKHLWRRVFQIFMTSQNVKHRARLWSALSGIDDENLLLGMLNAFLSKDHSLETVLERLLQPAENPLAAKLILEYILTHVPMLTVASFEVVEKATRCLKKLIYFIEDINLIEQTLSYTRLCKKIPQAREVEETIMEMIIWNERQSDVVKEWLQQFFEH